MRSINERIDWFRSHTPSAVGMCLRHTWLATDIPAVGLPDANAGVAYVKKHHKLHTDRHPPRGAWVWWTSSTHGHVCLSLGDGRILSTDVKGPATTGVVGLSFPETQWGQRYAGWSSWYGVSFTVASDRRERLQRRVMSLRKQLARVLAKLGR
jgi:hypothetical protein